MPGGIDLVRDTNGLGPVNVCNRDTRALRGKITCSNGPDAACAAQNENDLAANADAHGINPFGL
jgi:hypothetical protein